MPHLSPIFWTLAIFIFTANLILLTSALWWDQSPSFPLLSSNIPTPNNWLWN